MRRFKKKYEGAKSNSDNRHFNMTSVEIEDKIQKLLRELAGDYLTEKTGLADYENVHTDIYVDCKELVPEYDKDQYMSLNFYKQSVETVGLVESKS